MVDGSACHAILPACRSPAQLALLQLPPNPVHCMHTVLQEVSEPGSRSAIKVHSVSWLELACRFVGVLPGRYRACWRMRLCGHFHFTGGRLVVRHLPATCPAALEAVAAGAADPLLPILQEDGVRGQLRANAAPEPREARTQLTVVTRAHLDEAFQQVGGRGLMRPLAPCCAGPHRQQGNAWRPAMGASFERGQGMLPVT